MPTFKKYLLLLFLLFSVVISSSQSHENIIFSNLQKKDGLPNNNIHSITKDKLGFLWIGTNDGLCRYDGPGNIKVIRQDKEGQRKQGSSLKSNIIRALHCDHEGILWVGTRFGGLSSYNINTDEWKTYLHDPKNEHSLNNDEVLSIFEDSKRRLWIGTEKGLQLYTKESDSFTRILLFDSNTIEREKAVLTLSEDNQGWIWAGTWGGGLHLILNDAQGNLVKDQTRHIKITDAKKANNVWCIFQDSANRHWIGTHGGGLLLMNLGKNATNVDTSNDWEVKFTRYTALSKEAPLLRSNAFQDIIEDSQGDIWLGTTFGLYRIKQSVHRNIEYTSKSDLELQRYLESANEYDHIVGNNINQIIEDEQGMMWIATSDGLSQYNRYANQFENYTIQETEQGLPFSPNLVIDNQENIWIAAATDGLLKYKIKNDRLEKVKKSFAHLYIGKNVLSIFSPSEKELYVGTEKGISKIHLPTMTSTKYPIVSAKGLQENLILTTLFVDNKNFIWAGSKIGLIRINPNTKNFKLFESKNNDYSSISDNPVNAIVQDKNNHLWIGTYKGLNRVRNIYNENLEFERFYIDENDNKHSLISNQIKCLKVLDNYLYIGTIIGLCKYNLDTELFERSAVSLPKYWIRSIEEGKNNTLWMGTNEGLLRMDKDLNIYRIFDKIDGLMSSTFLLGSSAKDKNDNLYFGSFKNITRFDPSQLYSNTTPPPVYITAIEMMTPDGIKTENGINRSEIKLDPATYRFSVNFASLNYNRTDKNRFKYKLEGFEENWNESSSGSPIVYTSLKPDEYNLRVITANNDGVWNEEGASLTIIQKAHYWKTWWFRLLALGLAMLLVYLYVYNIRMTNAKLQTYNASLNEEITNRKKAEEALNANNAELKRSNKELEQFAYIASHDLKEPLRTIGNFSSLLSIKYTDRIDADANQYIQFIESSVGRMSQVIESLLIYSVVGKKESVFNLVDLNKLVQEKIQDLDKLIKDRKATIDIEPLPNIICNKQQLGMVFFNLINNGIKFNEQSNPSIVIKKEESNKEYWKFSVSDNGIGIQDKFKQKVFDVFNRLHGSEYEGTGIGLAVCQKIVTRHRGKIWFDSKEGKGTKFIFTIKKELDEI